MTLATAGASDDDAMTMNPILSKLAVSPEFTCGSGCTVDEVALLESTAGGPLPECYCEFLINFSFAIWDGGSLHGRYELGSVLPASYDLDAVRWTVKERARGDPKCFDLVSKRGLVISKYDGGGFYFLRTNPDRTSGVELYEFHEEDGPTLSWPSLEAYLSHTLGEASANA